MPYDGAAFMNALAAWREPMGLVQPKSKITHVGFLMISTISNVQKDAGRRNRLSQVSVVPSMVDDSATGKANEIMLVPAGPSGWTPS
eukprot:5320765-Lingulodinium_polyedra.AAC.1